MKNKRNYLKERGITLIALVVTIVVLLILAGVTINAVFSDSGIIKKAQDAQNKANESVQKDMEQINALENWLNENTGENNQGKFTQDVTIITADPAIEEGKSVKITNDITYENYTGTTVQNAVKRFDAGEIPSTRNLLTELKIDVKNEEFKTVKGNVIDILRFRPLTLFRDIYITDGKSKDYTLEGTVKYKENLLKNLEIEMSDIIVLGIDSEREKVFFYELESYDKNTGEISFEIKVGGPIIILTKTEDEFTQTVNIINGSENIEEGKQLEISNDVWYEDYSNSTVFETTSSFDNGEISSIQELFDSLEFSAQNVQTNKNNNIELSKLRAVTLFRDIYITDGENREYIEETSIEISYKEKFMKKLENGEEIIILSINQEDGSINFYEVEDYNNTTGEITFELENLGPILILAKK